MIVVSAGVLANPAAPFDSAPEGRNVFVDAFAVDRTEVTNAAFAAFVGRTGYVTLAEQEGDPQTWRTAARPDTGAHPVRFIAWADANAYCVDAGLRLPTELEWERAARGDDGRLWPWGNEWDGSRLNSLERAATGPSPVGSYPLGASSYGHVDLAGNVWEWTASPYLTDTAQDAPDAQSVETFRGHLVLRGGSWRTMAAGTQATYRKPAPPEYRRDTTGFRCAGDSSLALVGRDRPVPLGDAGSPTGDGRGRRAAFAPIPQSSPVVSMTHNRPAGVGSPSGAFGCYAAPDLIASGTWTQGGEMGGEIQFGIQTTATKPWPEMVQLWQTAEAIGFESCWLPDHLVPPFNLAGQIFEAWTLLAGLATVTERVRIGILVSCNTFRHPPLVAKEAVTIDHISGGRLEFGLGAGWFVPEHEMFGIGLPERKELVDRFREAVEVCDLLFTQEISSYDGTYYQLREAPFRPSSVQRPRPPFTLAAHGPKMLRIVAKHAQRWNSTGTVEQMRERNAILDEQCAAIGRDPATILRSHLYVPAILTGERPWDSPEAFVDFVGRFREAGVTEFIVQPPVQDTLATVERIAPVALPAARHGGTGSSSG